MTPRLADRGEQERGETLTRIWNGVYLYQVSERHFTPAMCFLIAQRPYNRISLYRNCRFCTPVFAGRLSETPRQVSGAAFSILGDWYTTKGV